MRFDVISLFPDMFSVVRDMGVTGRAHKQNRWSLAVWNPRDFTCEVHRTLDDRTHGGGAGMGLMPEPLEQAVSAVKEAAQAAAAVAGRDTVRDTPVVLMSAAGKRFDQAAAQEFARGDGAILICGRYEG